MKRNRPQVMAWILAALLYAAAPAGAVTVNPSFETGTYTLTLGVHDVEDTWVGSSAIFDNFFLRKAPEPNTFFLVAGGLLGLNWQARRRKAQRASS